MLRLTDIRKSYTTSDFTQTALDGVSLTFRDNEFAAVLGPSGSGKTTMLNIIGGLDHYDSGDLEIDGISTKKYTSRDWDTYRNNRIGFVFQSYNLIPHQSVLSNVELALTLSGVSASERRWRAKRALAEVGLGDHIHKRPSQLSGGQMQRVAIARALINDPEILLADEPTGALDTKTSTQVMDLLTEIAKDRLVIMVTHNNELAEQYANRIIHLKDGQIMSDSRPLEAFEKEQHTGRSPRRASMSFITAILLSFSNLMTKKGRTFVTALAGSIGIIGIAAILALANGINVYIDDIEKETLSIYPLTVQNSGFDFTSLMTDYTDTSWYGSDDSSAYSVNEQNIIETMFAYQSQNDLVSLKAYLDENEEEIGPHVNAIQYVYDITPQIYLEDTSAGVDQVNPDSIFDVSGLGGISEMMSMSGVSGMNVFHEMPGELEMFEHQYQVVAGKWPESYDETVLVLSSNGGISDYELYAMGLRDRSELRAMLESFVNSTETDIAIGENNGTLTYDDLMSASFKVINPADQYQYDENYEIWVDKSGDDAYMKSLVDEGMTLKIVGIVQPEPDATVTSLSSGINYRADLISHLMEEAASTEIVRQQLENPTVNILTGETFDKENEVSDDPVFDFAELFSIDEDAAAGAFDMDMSALDMDIPGFDDLLPDMSDLDLSAFEFDIAGMDVPDLDIGMMEVPDMDFDLEEMTNEIAGQFNIDAEQIMVIMGAVLQDFLLEEISNGVTDPAQISDDLSDYLARPDVQAAIEAQLMQIIDPTQIQEQVSSTLQIYIESMMQTYLTQASDAIQAYMQTVMQQYMEQMMDSIQTQFLSEIQGQVESQSQQVMQDLMEDLPDQLMDAISIDQEAFMEAFQLNMDEDEILDLLASFMNTEESTLERNLSTLGYADTDAPSQINIYPLNFQSKEEIIVILDQYNERMEANGEPDKVIRYTDLVGVMMSSVTDIINTVSYALIAFVAISLVVSSIMIGVITYISVLERKKEIGILRAIGASKRNIRRVFNAETLIVGFVAGVLGILVTLLLCIPANIIVSNQLGIDRIAQLPTAAAFILIAVSMFLTFIAGLFPASAAARKDPVEALRSE